MKYPALVLAFSATTALADVPRVAVDIAPVHSIVSAVMGDLGSPDLIVPPGATPHSYALRPSQARALDRADIVIWVGPTLTPWFEGAIDSLAGDAVGIELLAHPVTRLLDVREGATFANDDHDNAQDQEEERAPGGDVQADDKAQSQDPAGNHAQNSDPHAWLNPDNAIAWAGVIADALADADPENATSYAANAQAFTNEINGLKVEIEAKLEPVKGRPFVVFHDAYHYFEYKFGIEAAGAVSSNDAVAPSPARVSALRSGIAALGATCALSEPQFNPGILDALGAVKLAEIDPLGAALKPGPDLYGQLLANMATSLADCLQ